MIQLERYGLKITEDPGTLGKLFRQQPFQLTRLNLPASFSKEAATRTALNMRRDYAASGHPRISVTVMPAKR